MTEGTDTSKVEGPLAQGEVFVYSEADWGGTKQRIAAAPTGVKPDFPPASIELGPRTGVTLFASEDETGLSQDLTANLASFTDSKLKGQNPVLLRVWSAAERPFSGYWAIEVAEGKYLSVSADRALTTSETVTDLAAFKIQKIEGSAAAFAIRMRGVIPVSESAGEAPEVEPPQSLTVDDLQRVAVAVETEAGFRRFSLLASNDQYICYNAEEDRFRTTTDVENRAIFREAIKIAENERQVGELIQGEVALFENPAYWGKAWVFYADCANFNSVAGLNDVVSSIQLGPLTGITIYSDADFNQNIPGMPKQDVTLSIASLKNQQVGEDVISSMDLWRIVPPEETGITFTCKLSQDFSTAGQKIKEFSAYRTIVQFPSTVQTVELWATDETDIEVDGNPYHVEEDRSILLAPNKLHRLVITSDAAGNPVPDGPKGCLRAPGLKIRTNTMALDQRVVIHPDREVHERLAALKQDEMYTAKYKDDTGEEHSIFINTSAQKQKDVNEAQKMISKVMSTVTYQTGALGGVDQAISPEALDGSWALDFSTYRVTVRTLFVRQGPDTSYPKLGYLKRNEVVQVLSFNVEGDWLQVKRLSDGLTGWSYGAFLGIIAESATNEQYRVKASMLQVREGPGTIHRQVGLLYKNEIVTATRVNEKGTWRKVTRKKDGLTGWCSADYLELAVPDPAAIRYGLPSAAAEQLPAPEPTLSGLAPRVEYHAVSAEEVQALLARAEFRDANLAQGFFDFCKDIYHGVKNAVQVVITQVTQAAQNAWAVIVDLGSEVAAWVVDTVEKAIACVEGIIEKIGAVIEEIIKWLRMIFDWQDILHTRDTLRDSLNNMLNYLAVHIGDAKPPVRRFFQDQRETLTAGLNRVILELGCAPAAPPVEVPSGLSEVTDAVDWVLSKLMGGVMPDFGAASVFASSATAEGDQKLDEYWSGTLARVIEVFASLPGLISNTVSSLIKDPTQPQLALAALLSAMSHLLNRLIDLGESLVVNLLDLGTYLIKNFTAVLNAKIRIPFISDLIEWIGSLFGKNWDASLGFSILDSVALILAIPVTILSKIRLGSAPFKHAAPLAANVTAWGLTAGMAGFVGGILAIMLDVAPETQQGSGILGSIMEVLSLVLVAFGLMGSWGPDFISAVKTNRNEAGEEPRPTWGFLLGFELGLFLLDIISLIYSAKKTHSAQRLKRFERDTIILASGLGVLHLALYVIKDLDHGDAGDIAPDCLMTLPEICSTIRLYKNPYATFFFGAVDFTAAGTSLAVSLI